MIRVSMLFITNWKIHKKHNNNEFSLIEIMVVITIIAILSAIAVPSVNAGVEKVKSVVCDYNCSQLEKLYKAFLVLENANHTEAMFFQYLQECDQDI